MAEETDARLWNRYSLALQAFQVDPSPQNEGVVIQTFSEFARSAHPDQAAELISLLTRHLVRFTEDRRG